MTSSAFIQVLLYLAVLCGIIYACLSVSRIYGEADASPFICQ